LRGLFMPARAKNLPNPQNLERRWGNDDIQSDLPGLFIGSSKRSLLRIFLFSIKGSLRWSN